MPTTSEKPIFILGAYGHNNIGDEALLEVFIAQFQDSPLVVNSAQPAATTARYNIDAVPTYWRVPRFERLRKILSARLIVFGGGSLLKEIEGGALEQVAYFFRILAILLLAKARGIPTAMLGNGMGPLRSTLYKNLTRWAANLTTLICVRDNASRELLESLNVKTKIHVTADPVFTYGEVLRLQEHQQEQQEEQENTAASSLLTRPWNFPSPFSSSEKLKVVIVPRYSLTDNERQILVETGDYLIAQQNAELVILPFQIGYLPRFDDTTAAHDLCACLKTSTAARVIETQEPREAFSVIGDADLVISVRLHGLIFAAMQSVPAVAISYEIKMQSFMDESLQTDACIVLGDLSKDKLRSTIESVLQNKVAIRTQLSSRAVQLAAAAQKNFSLARPLYCDARNRTGSQDFAIEGCKSSASKAHLSLPETSTVTGENILIEDNTLKVTSESTPPAGQSGMVKGSALFFISTVIVNAGNYLFNLILGRWLGPVAFADLSLIVTLFLMATLVTATLQTVAAKFVAAAAAENDVAKIAAARSWLNRCGWSAGIVIAILMCVGATSLQHFFHTASFWPFILLGIGIPIYFVQGVERGVLQGQMRFWPLSLSYQAEMWMRLFAAVVLVLLGFAVNGAVASLTISFFATWFVALAATRKLQISNPVNPDQRREINRFIVPVGASLLGQILVNNSDILIVRHFFESHAAGQYAALALIGRIVFFATWSVVTALFPVVAQRHQKGEPHRSLLALSLAMVAGVSGLIIAASFWFPTKIVQVLFGEEYLAIAPLLWLYGIATAIYALANVVINYRLALGQGGGSVLALVAGGAQVLALWMFHQSAEQVVTVQIYVMLALFTALLVWDQWLLRRPQENA